ncbi:MAG: hypothetical protein K8S97_04410 [Anaerolineae bacterium]|nr:hypothetical protein [Anaerolineae bacterium]
MSQQRPTQLWMSSIPVEFVKWTPNGLIYNRLGGDRETASLNRGMVKRLVHEGLLEIRGDCPDWVPACTS